MLLEAADPLPCLAPVLALEQCRRLDARPDYVRRLRVARLDVPGLAEIAAVFDTRTAPGRVDRGVHRAVARVIRGVMDRRGSAVRIFGRPFLAVRVAVHPVQTLLRADQEDHLLRHVRTSILPPESAGITCTMSPSRSVASSPPMKRTSSSFTKRLRCARSAPRSSRRRSARLGCARTKPSSASRSVAASTDTSRAPPAKPRQAPCRSNFT